MDRKFLISVAVIFVVSMILGLVVHGILLAPHYAQLPAMFRTEQDQAGYFPFMLVAHVFLAAGFVWIYRQGRSDKPYLGQGIRFGFAVAVLSTVSTYLIYYAVQPMPLSLVASQIVLDSVGMVIMGIVVARLNA